MKTFLMLRGGATASIIAVLWRKRHKGESHSGAVTPLLLSILCHSSATTFR